MWCEYQNSYTDKTGYYGFNALPDGTYQLIARAPETDSTKGDSGPTSITVTGGLGANNVKLTLQNPTVIGTVRGPKGVSPRNYLYVRVIDSDGGTRWPDYVRNKPSSGDGTFAFNLPPGTYQFEAQGDLANAGGVSARSSNCVVTDTSTVVTCNVNLLAPNLKVRVIKPDSSDFITKDVYSSIYFNGGSKINNSSPQLSLDAEGNLQTYLEDGAWTFVARAPSEESLFSEKIYEISVASGAVVSIKDSEGNAQAASNGVFRLSVTGSNVTGEITFEGSRYRYGTSVSIERLYGEYFGGVNNVWVYGQYGFKVEPGVYRIRVEPYGLPSTQVAQTFSDTFTVGDTSTSVINVALRTPNLLGHLKTPTGENYRLANAYIRSSSDKKSFSQKYVRIENDGKFGAYLEQGTYQIEFNPYWDQLKNFAPRSYEIVMGASSITSIRDLTSNETLTPVNGYYSFKVSTSSVKGKVLPPGTSTIGLSNVQIVVAPIGTPDYWRYSTTSDGEGNFGLLVPDGTYVIRAIPYNGQYQYGKSESQTVVVSGGTTASPIELRLRAPNLTGRIVTPGASPAALANVNINAWIDGEYFYGWTDNSGAFGFFVEKPSPQCPARCEIQLNYYKSSEYTAKTYRISSVGAQGDLAIGGVTSRLTVLVPQSGSTTVANSYGWVSVESIDSVTSSASYVTGGQTDDLGKVGLSLTDGMNYRITAYPGYKVNGKFAQKVLLLNNYSSSTHATLSMTFDRPNFLVSVTGSTGVMNSYGWTRVTKYDSATATYQFHSNVYLDDKGETAYTFADGTYQITFRPGKTIGSQRTVTLTVTSGVATCSSGCGSVTSGVTPIRLPNGNISGVVTTSTGSAAKSVYVVATMVSDSTKTVTAITSDTGLYEIYLDTSYAWTIGAVDPGTGEKGSTSLSATPGNSNTVATDKNFSMAP